jgi:DNA-binding response OmpR family regulator
MQSPQQIVLVVDDHRETADVIAEILREGGIAALAAYSGLDALRLYDAHRPAVVITDQSLQDGVTGSDLLRALRRKYGAAVGRAVFLTGAPENVDCPESDLLLEKPISIETLLTTVRALLDRSPAAREAH